MTASSISALAIESRFFALWQEFLAGYFDGQSHTVGANPAIAFPSAYLRFQQSLLPQPIDGVAITAVWVRPSYFEKKWDTVNGGRQEVVFARFGMMFWVRAQMVSSGTGNSAFKCTQAAELLFGLLQNSAATRPLAGKGIHRLRPSSPQLVSDGSGSRPNDPSYALRVVTCDGRLHYPVLSQS